MTKYEIIFYWSEEDNCFVAEVPELDNLMAHGDTKEETLQNINDAIDLWIEVAEEDGRQIPKPKGKLMFA